MDIDPLQAEPLRLGQEFVKVVERAVHPAVGGQTEEMELPAALSNIFVAFAYLVVFQQRM